MLAFRIASRSRLPTTQLSALRGYKSRITPQAFLEGKNLAQVKDAQDAQDTAAYVVADNTPPSFKLPAGVKVLGFKYPGAAAPDNKTFYAVAPRKPPVVLAGISGDYVERLYTASLEANELMQTEEQLTRFVKPLAEDDEVGQKFFTNPTVTMDERLDAVGKFAKENGLSETVTGFLNEVVQNQHTEELKDVVTTYADLMKRVRCEATAEVTFGRVPTQREVDQVKQLLANLRSPTQYYVHRQMFVDPSIGGGLVVSMGDFELDGSLNTRTNEVHKHLVKSLQN